MESHKGTLRDSPGRKWTRKCYAKNEQVHTALPVGGTEVLVLKTSRRGTKIVKHPGLSLQRERGITCFLPRRLGADVVYSLVTSHYLCG